MVVYQHYEIGSLANHGVLLEYRVCVNYTKMEMYLQRWFPHLIVKLGRCMCMEIVISHYPKLWVKTRI